MDSNVHSTILDSDVIASGQTLESNINFGTMGNIVIWGGELFVLIIFVIVMIKWVGKSSNREEPITDLDKEQYQDFLMQILKFRRKEAIKVIDNPSCMKEWISFRESQMKNSLQANFNTKK